MTRHGAWLARESRRRRRRDASYRSANGRRPSPTRRTGPTSGKGPNTAPPSASTRLTGAARGALTGAAQHYGMSRSALAAVLIDNRIRL